MAFDKRGLSFIGGLRGQTPQTWAYKTTDTLAAVEVDGYFDNGTVNRTEMRAAFQVGDAIDVHCSMDAIPAISRLYVRSIVNGIIATMTLGPRDASGRLMFPPRTTPLRTAVYGHSIANIGTPQGPDNQDFSIFTAAHPGSGATSLVFQPTKWVLGFHYPHAFPVFNGGVSGDTIVQMLARDAAVASVTRKAVLDLHDSRSDVVIVRFGINDVIALTAASTQGNIDTIYDNGVLLLNRILSASPIVVLEDMFGYSPGSGTQADLDFRRAAMIQLNSRLAAYAATLPGRVYFLDTTGTLHDSTGNYLSGVALSDGIHLNAWGGYLLGALEASLFTRIFGPSSGSRFPGTNVITNSLFTATTSEAYGTKATGFSIFASNATRQNAKVETINGKRWQTCEFLITAAAAQGQILMPFDPTAMSISANDIYGFELDFLIQGPTSGSAPPVPTVTSLALDVYKNAAGRVVVDAIVPGTYAAIGGVYTGHVAFPYKFAEASAALTNSSNWTMTYKTDANDGSVFKLGVSMPRIVKLGTAVVTG